MLFIADSETYMHLSIVVHYKIVCNKVLCKLYIFLLKLANLCYLYWDNKFLPSPALTLPVTFIFNFSIICFILLKKEKSFLFKSLAKGRFELDLVKMKNVLHTLNHLHHWRCHFAAVFCNAISRKHTLVGGVSVNSLCQQVGLFSLSVNRHSEMFIFTVNSGTLQSSQYYSVVLTGQDFAVSFSTSLNAV